MKRWLHLGPYSLIGGACAVLNVAVMIAGDRAGLNYVTATAVSFCLCVLFGYWLHSRFTFLVHPSLSGLGGYAAAMALNFPLAVFLMWLFHEALLMTTAIAAIATTVALTGYNYLSSRWAIQHRSRTSEVEP